MTDPTAQIVSDVLKSYPSLIILLYLISRVASFVANKLYPDLKTALTDAVTWYRSQLDHYMQMDREIVESTVKERVLTASKWQPVNGNGIPPAPG